MTATAEREHATQRMTVDADPRRVVHFTPPNQVQILGPEDTLDGGDVLPGFQCKVAEMFV
jgi:hypothetical protein